MRRASPDGQKPVPHPPTWVSSPGQWPHDILRGCLDLMLTSMLDKQHWIQVWTHSGDIEYVFRSDNYMQGHMQKGSRTFLSAFLGWSQVICPGDTMCDHLLTWHDSTQAAKFPPGCYHSWFQKELQNSLDEWMCNQNLFIYSYVWLCMTLRAFSMRPTKLSPLFYCKIKTQKYNLLLSKPYTKEGLNLPNFKCYYLASQFCPI